jgi:hypothetical protein
MAAVCAVMLAVNGVVCAESQQDYDYRSLAVQSILTSAQEAQKLPNIEQRISLVIAAANLLPTSHRREAVALLEDSLKDLRDWNSNGKKDKVDRAIVNRLSNDLLAAYAKLDPERALANQNIDRDEETPGDGHKYLRAGGKWSAEILARRGPADQAAGLALSIIDADPERAFSLVVQSVRDGIVSNSLNAIFDKLQQKQDRRFLDQLQIAVAQSLATTFTFDPFSLGYAAALLDDDRMPTVAKRRIIRFLMNSTEIWASLVKGDDGNGGLDPSYVSSSFMRFFLNVRPAIAKYSPTDILKFDILLDQTSRFVPEKTKSNLQVFQQETLTDSRERLNAILREPGAEKRDLNLIGLASELFRKLDASDYESGLDLLTDTINQFSDARLKTTFGDLLLIKRLNSLVRVKKFDSARKLVASISAAETRVWAMLALAVAAKEDKVLAFELTTDAIKALDAVSASPAKVALALMGAALLAEDSPQRSFDLLSSAAKDSNSSKDSSENTDVASAIGLTASIGNLSVILAREPKSLADVKIDRRLAPLAKTDWFRSQQIANSFADQSLRLRLKLQFAAGVLGATVR